MESNKFFAKFKQNGEKGGIIRQIKKKWGVKLLTSFSNHQFKFAGKMRLDDRLFPLGETLVCYLYSTHNINKLHTDSSGTYRWI